MITIGDKLQPGNGTLRLPRKPFEYIAFWQFLSFVMLVGLIWVNETADLTAAIYGTGPGDMNWMGASLLTVFAIVVGFVTVAHTYVQQQRILRGVLTICCRCKKVRINEDIWEQVDAYVAEKTLAQFSHGFCPDCYREELTKGIST